MAALNEGPEDGKESGERIAKVIARSGLCSRRDAEVLIGEKRVSVNGAVIESAALDVTPADKVLVDGKPLAAREAPRLWRYHKPKGRVTTHKDPEGRPTVFEAMPENLPRLISVGRLDFNTEGLLLLTNDGDLARHLELPSTAWTRRYRVRAFGRIEQAQLDELAQGLRTGGVNYGPIEAQLEREQGDNVWITLSIREGKNREVRRIMEHLGLTVNRLIRVSFGPFILGDLEPGQIEEVKTSVLKDQLGPRLARQLGVKREPLREDRKLAPGRSKPTYLRRKPSPAAAPERPTEERPMKRRRIFQEGGGEAPMVELVPEKRRRPPRPDRDGELFTKPFHRGGEDRPEREDRQYPPRRDGGERRIGKPGSAAEGFPERRSREDRPEREDRKYPPRRDGGERRIGKSGSAAEGVPDRRTREDRPEREDRKYPPRRDGGERRIGRPGSAAEGFPERRSRENRPEREDRKYPPRRDGGERRIGKPGSAAEGFPERRSREDRPEREDRKYPPRPDGGERRFRKPGSASEGRGENHEGKRRFGEKPPREPRAGLERPQRREFERPQRQEKEESARGERPSVTERDRPSWKSRPERSEEPRRSRPPRDESKGEQRRFDSKRTAGKSGEPRQGERAAKRFGTDEGRPKFGNRFRKDEGGGGTDRPAWRERKAGEKSPANSDTESRYVQRSERHPRARRDEASVEPGKPGSFAKRSFKEPKREAPARGEGKPFNRRQGPSRKPGSGKPRPHTPEETS